MHPWRVQKLCLPVRLWKGHVFFVQEKKPKLIKFTSTFAHMHILDTEPHYRIVDFKSVSKNCVALIINGKLYATPLSKTLTIETGKMIPPKCVP